MKTDRNRDPRINQLDKSTKNHGVKQKSVSTWLSSILGIAHSIGGSFIKDLLATELFFKKYSESTIKGGILRLSMHKQLLRIHSKQNTLPGCPEMSPGILLLPCFKKFKTVSHFY